MEDERIRLVADGYDRIAERYREWTGQFEDEARGRFGRDFAARLPAGARVLELGCGAGVPSTRELARRFSVVGVDVSAAQLERARRSVPDATFVRGDVTQVDFPPGSFRGVVAFYVVSHVPRDRHAELFAKVARWLVPGGLFVATLGAADQPDWTGDWLGVPMFFSSHDADTNRQLLRDAGFELLVDEVVATPEPEGPVSFLWVIAQKLSRA